MCTHTQHSTYLAEVEGHEGDVAVDRHLDDICQEARLGGGEQVVDRVQVLVAA